MEIEIGLFSGMVLQRNRHGVCDVEFSGKTPATGLVQLRAGRPGAARPAGWATVGKAARGRFAGKLAGLKAGGPYEVQLRIVGEGGQAAQTKVSGVLVGDVWLAAGQSNMQGIGQSNNRLPDDPLVRAFYMDDRWALAREPLHNMWDAIDQVHLDLSGGSLGTKPAPGTMISPGVSFAQEMRRRTGVPQGVIACAHGGTSMPQWDPSLAKLGTKSLYGAMMRRFVKNGSRVAGMIWYQGESDATQQAAPLFAQRVKNFVRALRRDCRDAALPVVMVQIGRVAGFALAGQKGWNRIQNEQRLLPRTIKHLAIVPAIDLRLSDLIHISGDEQYRLGVRLGQAMAAIKRLPRGGLLPIELKTSRLRTDPASGNADIVVEFANVAGKLRSTGRPMGFSLNAGQAGENCIYDTRLDGNKVVLKICSPSREIGGKSLHYGFGLDPSCNITDEADRSLPVFGPIMVGRQRAMMPFVRNVRISAMLPTGPIEEVQLPAVTLAPRAFETEFLDLHAELETIREDRLVYFVSEFQCSQPMKLAACLGYDGPVKAWVDGCEMFVDPNGTNPAIIDKQKIKFDAAPGRHQVVVALNSHKGLAWGIYLRFERLDVSRAMLAKSPDQVVLPTLA